MSRIGKLPINIPEGVDVSFDKKSNTMLVKGKIGELEQYIDPKISVEIKDNEIVFNRHDESKESKSKHGLYRSLVNNMVIGVSKGFTITQELVGVGYRASNNGQILELSLGYSHDYYIELPTEIKIETVSEKGKLPKVILTSADKQLVGQVAAKLRSLRKPEPYKGKGIKYQGEVLRRKEGKAAAAE